MHRMNRLTRYAFRACAVLTALTTGLASAETAPLPVKVEVPGNIVVAGINDPLYDTQANVVQPAFVEFTSNTPEAVLINGQLLGGLLGRVINLPVKVVVTGNTAVARIGNLLGGILGDVTLTFDDASGLTPSSLGITAQLVDPSDPRLLGRISNLLSSITSALPLLVTIAPPSKGGLSFRRTGRYELHVGLLPYTPGSDWRVFKAPLLGGFRDVTEEIAPGSVRARSRYGGFSQFLLLLDLRPTGTVITEKIAYLRTRIAMLPASERPAFTVLLNAAESAVASGNFAAAIVAIDSISARATARAGTHIPDVWRASGGVDNHAGELIAGAATLKFSVAHLRDYGQ